MNEASEPSAYELLGGEEAMRRLVNRFYDLMDEDESVRELRAMHASDLGPMRERLFEYLSAWLGGPKTYFERPDRACIVSAHSPFAIGERERDQWLRCMNRALEESAADPALKEALGRALYRLADAFRNR